MTKNRITGAIAALSLLAVPAVAAAHGNGHHTGHHHKHHGKKAKSRVVSGTVTSFTDGALTITLTSGRAFTADVTKRTILECRSAPVVAAAAGHGHGDDDGPNHDHGSATTPATTTVPPATATHGHGVRCGTDALVAGAKVTDAKLVIAGGNAVWKKVELQK